MKQLLLIAIPGFLFASCYNTSKPALIASEAARIDSSPGSCPYLTRDAGNHLVLSWIRQLDSTRSVYCYAVSKDEGKTFGKTIVIPGSTNVHPHGENMPKLLFKPSGEIIAAWGATNPNPNNKYSGLVYYSQSFDEGRSWTKPRSLTTDTASFDQRYFDMALLPGGEAAMVWLDNRKPWNKDGSGLYYAVTKGNSGFQDEKLIGGPCCQCCRTDLFVDRNKNIHVLFRAILNDSIRDMVHIVSTDDGGSFTQPERISKDNWVISGCPHTGPAMAENQSGLHFTWFTGGNGSGIYYNNSGDNGRSFTARDSVSGKASKHCQITSLANGNILIVWNESFVKAGQVSSRIGMEERNAKGDRVAKEYITGENSNSSFPVIYPVSANLAVVAYTEDSGGKEHILLKQVALN